MSIPEGLRIPGVEGLLDWASASERGRWETRGELLLLLLLLLLKK